MVDKTTSAYPAKLLASNVNSQPICVLSVILNPEPPSPINFLYLAIQSVLVALTVILKDCDAYPASTHATHAYLQASV